MKMYTHNEAFSTIRRMKSLEAKWMEPKDSKWNKPDTEI
jgi:hypothetical protein